MGDSPRYPARAKRFRVALSFAGEKRDFVEHVAAILAHRFSREAVLYDKYHEAELSAQGLGLNLPGLYHEESDLVVVVVCRDYAKKEWGGLEWDAIFDLLKKRKITNVMLCRFDHATVEGLCSSARFVELDGRTPQQAAGLILQRLALHEGKPRNYYFRRVTDAKSASPALPIETTGDARDKGRIDAVAPGHTGPGETVTLPSASSRTRVPRPAIPASAGKKHKFDVFFSHNRQDKLAVRDLAEVLRERGIKVWLDEWELIPGQPWQEALEQAIGRSKSAAVLIGHDGIGPWEDREMSGCLSEFVARKMPVIPVLLPGCKNNPKLPIFLKQFTWVDLRDGVSEEGLRRLIRGITGEKPVPPPGPDAISWTSLWISLRKRILPIAVAVLMLGAFIAVWRYHQRVEPSPVRTTEVPSIGSGDSRTDSHDALVPPDGEGKDTSKTTTANQPTIAITAVLPAEDGDNEIEGTVVGVDPVGCKVVVYAFDGRLWHIQPDTETPWAEIARDGRWSIRTHRGVRYAALLVRDNPNLPIQTDKLPELSDYVLARYEKTTLLEERKLP